jgi:hypothetical protein
MESVTMCEKSANSMIDFPNSENDDWTDFVFGSSTNFTKRRESPGIAAKRLFEGATVKVE